MTAGRGIVHSERSPGEERAHEAKPSGIQSWLALTDEVGEMARRPNMPISASC